MIIFPRHPADAITIHKSQGDTYENVVVHMEIRMRSLTKHWRHYKADNYLMPSNILMLVETRACKTDLVEIPAFQLGAEISADTRVAGQGSRVYSKLQVEDFQIICHHEIKSSVEIIKFRLNELNCTYFLCVYRSPKLHFKR